MDFITEIFEPVEVVMEMATDQSRLVPLSPEFLQSVVQDDDSPLFGTYVIESGWSKSKRLWGPELFGGVASEINDAAVSEPIVGYLGHIRPEADPYDFPEIQLQWVGAKLLETGDKARLAVKAYFLPGTQAKGYAKRKLANTVSWRGKVAQEIFQKGVRIKEFAIESIDLARPRAAGMSARLVALSSEMEENEGRNEVKPEEIAALSANELRAHNSGLVTTIEAEARKPLETQVSEMSAEADAVKPTLNLIPELRKLLGLSDDTDDVKTLTTVVSHLRSAGKSLRDSVLASVLDKKLKGEGADQMMVRKLIASEIRDRDFILTGDTDKDEKLVGEMVDEIVSRDTDLKQMVSEMEGAPASPPQGGEDRRSGQKTELKAGFSNTRIRVRNA